MNLPYYLGTSIWEVLCNTGSPYSLVLVVRGICGDPTLGGCHADVDGTKNIKLVKGKINK